MKGFMLWSAISTMTDSEFRALYIYLQSLPKVETRQ